MPAMRSWQLAPDKIIPIDPDYPKTTQRPSNVFHWLLAIILHCDALDIEHGFQLPQSIIHRSHTDLSIHLIVPQWNSIPY